MWILYLDCILLHSMRADILATQLTWLETDKEQIVVFFHRASIHIVEMASLDPGEIQITTNAGRYSKIIWLCSNKIDTFVKPSSTRWVDYISDGTWLWKISTNLLILVGLYQELAYAWVVTPLLVCEELWMRGRWRGSCSPAASRTNSAEPTSAMTANWTQPPSVTCQWMKKIS